MPSKKKTKNEQRYCLISDTHCGALNGLTMTPGNAIQTQLLNRYNDFIEWFGDPPDVVILVGDGIDGADKKGHDTTTSRMHEQAADCARLLAKLNATTEYIIVGGTGYHTEADGQELDRMICGELEGILRNSGDLEPKVTYRRKLKTTINDWFTLECRHKIGSSSVPHGRSTAQARAKYWQVINAAIKSARSGQAAIWPNLLVFAHVHYYNLQEDDFGTVMSLPCWQAMGGKYGDKECDGYISIGASKLTVGAEAGQWNVNTRRYLASVVDRMEHR